MEGLRKTLSSGSPVRPLSKTGAPSSPATAPAAAAAAAAAAEGPHSPPSRRGAGKQCGRPRSHSSP
ncbi:hypothetical protein ETH_00036475 [Eimeria tenella]|uniref:Uncharacterized protein n=1 Tax=Eimeria tenella TaxID=5802 RepID=U6L234_EIMTE|nr:hypothetical protein ETH_00036475 [Eimeria tenella]CDJ44432.1 hypothetical protein ETH_00036475 [Eimeria tenella]|eukprot:XP_013235181.1 hypothetical protein ETH_00036475 [Eimeria tenella]